MLLLRFAQVLQAQTLAEKQRMENNLKRFVMQQKADVHFFKVSWPRTCVLSLCTLYL